MPPLLEVDGLVKHFPLRGLGVWLDTLRGRVPPAVRAVDGVSLAIDPGETVGLVGESGCGKSTVARCLLRLIEPTAGHIGFDGVDLTALAEEPLRRRRRDIQMVFQDPTASLNPRFTVRRTVEDPLRLHTDFNHAVRRERAREVLAQVGLGAELLDRYPHELSGGQRQRVNIARAIATEPRFVVLDEPTSALDVSLRARIILLLAELRAKLGMTCLFISHDLATVRGVVGAIDPIPNTEQTHASSSTDWAWRQPSVRPPSTWGRSSSSPTSGRPPPPVPSSVRPRLRS